MASWVQRGSEGQETAAAWEGMREISRRGVRKVQVQERKGDEMEMTVKREGRKETKKKKKKQNNNHITKKAFWRDK